MKRPIGGKLRKASWGALGVALLLILAACTDTGGELLPEKDERAFRRGINLRNEGRPREALLQFYDVIAERPTAPESHLEAGLLYLNHIGDPISAIYHFNRYVSYKPDGEEVDRVRGLINTGLKEIVRDIPPFNDEVERLDIYTRLQSLEKENVQLRQQLATVRQDLLAWQEHSGQLDQALAQARRQLEGTPAPVAPIVVRERPALPPGAVPATGGPRSYTVQPGDTLSRISREMYGTSGRWSEIFEANRDVLPSQNSLRPGQVLTIP